MRFDGHTMHYTDRELLANYQKEEKAQLHLAAISKTLAHRKHHNALAWQWREKIEKLKREMA